VALHPPPFLLSWRPPQQTVTAVPPLARSWSGACIDPLLAPDAPAARGGPAAGPGGAAQWLRRLRPRCSPGAAALSAAEGTKTMWVLDQPVPSPPRNHAGPRDKPASGRRTREPRAGRGRRSRASRCSRRRCSPERPPAPGSAAARRAGERGGQGEEGGEGGRLGRERLSDSDSWLYQIVIERLSDSNSWLYQIVIERLSDSDSWL
jgi:hypothetical protein